MKSLIRCKIEMELRKKFLNEANNHSSHPAVLDDTEISYGSIGTPSSPFSHSSFSLSLFFRELLS